MVIPESSVMFNSAGLKKKKEIRTLDVQLRRFSSDVVASTSPDSVERREKLTVG